MVKGLLDSLREPGLRTAALPPSTRFGTISGEPAFPDGYGLLDKARIEHVHLKDYVTGEATGERKIVGVGEGKLPYSDIFLALDKDGYDGALSMETHHRIAGSKEAASRLSMQGIVKALRVIR